MLLAIDAGNTNVVFAIFDGEDLRGIWRSSTEVKRTADEYAVWFTQLMALADLSPKDIDACIIASVVPEIVFNLTSLAERYFRVRARVVGEPGLDLGIGIKLDRPEEVGADRLVNAVAARALLPAPFIVVDFGTATTFDVVDADGDYAGGAIAPGINLSLQALYMAAAKLPRVALKKPPQVIGTGTVTAMQSGIFWGYIGLIEGLIRRIRDESGAPVMPVIATGGLASLFAGATSLFDRVEPDLTLAGLRRIHHDNPVQ
jgi:type III pantothenate kinase